MKALILLAACVLTLSLSTTAQATGRFARQRVVIRQPARQAIVQPRRQVIVQRQLIQPRAVFVELLHAPQIQLRSFGQVLIY